MVKNNQNNQFITWLSKYLVIFKMPIKNCFGIRQGNKKRVRLIVYKLQTFSAGNNGEETFYDAVENEKGLEKLLIELNKDKCDAVKLLAIKEELVQIQTQLAKIRTQQVGLLTVI